MSRMRKVYKKYERWVLLGLVVLLLATFSVAGAAQCGQQTGRSSLHLGGTYKVSPTEEAEVSDEDFDRFQTRYRNFLQAVGVPTREFMMEVLYSPDREVFKAAWKHRLIHEAALAAGYRAGPAQTNQAVRDFATFALRRAQLEYSDVNFQKLLAENFRGTEDDFRAGAAQIVEKDQFLYPLVQSARYEISYPEAFEQWKAERERVDLQSIALPAAPFADIVGKEEATRRTIGEQELLLGRVVSVAASVRRVDARVEAHKKDAGAYPENLAAIPGFNPAKDAWGEDLRYKLVAGEPDVRSAGPDGAFDTLDDVTMDTHRQLDTHANLFELATKLRARHTAKEAWPAAIADLKEAGDDGQLPALTRDIKDGWDQDFVYAAPADGSDAAPTLRSIGPDGKDGTDDDIVAVLTADSVSVSPGPGLKVYVADDLADAWGNALHVELRRAQPPTWRVESGGADGDVATSEDNLLSGNERELRAFFTTMRGDFVEEATREFETLFVHLPLVSDAAMKRLWDAYPQFHPKDEEKLFEDWRAFRGEVFYTAKDPADAETGHGAQHARDVAPEAKPTLVPSKDIFPANLSKPDAPKDDDPKDDEPKDDDPKDDDPKDDDPKDDDPKDDEPAEDEGDDADRKAFLEQGWREIVIRQRFFESLLNDILQRVRKTAEARERTEALLKRWESNKAAREKAQAEWDTQWKGKEAEADTPRPADFDEKQPEVPEELTFEQVLADELGDLVASGDELTPPAIQFWRTPKPMTREEYEANPNFGTGLQFELNRLATDGAYNTVPAQLANRLTKVLVRRIAYKPQRQQDFDEVADQVFDRWVERRQVTRARDELGKLETAIKEAEAALGEDADEAAKAKAAQDAIETWAKAVGVEPIIERTGLFIGNTPPPAVEVSDDMDAEAKSAVLRRNFVWRQGYATVRPSDSPEDKTTAEPGTFGRQVLVDPVQDGEGSGHAFLIRVAARQHPSKHEFSPRRYARFLRDAVFGDRRQFMKPLSEQEGRYNKALARWFDNLPWLMKTFDLEPNSPIDPTDGPTRR